MLENDVKQSFCFLLRMISFYIFVRKDNTDTINILTI